MVLHILDLISQLTGSKEQTQHNGNPYSSQISPFRTALEADASERQTITHTMEELLHDSNVV